MTPRRLDVDSVTAKLELMDGALAILRGIEPVDAERLDVDGVVRGAVERYLMLLVDQAVAINLHLASVLGGAIERDYTTSFAAAAEVGVITRELAAQLAGSAGMRNVLVHEYVRVDTEQVAAAVPRAVEGYGAYVRSVAAFLRAT